MRLPDSSCDTSPSASLRRAIPDADQKDSQQAGRITIDLSRLVLPVSLWKDMNERCQVYFLQWKQQLLQNRGDCHALLRMKPPTHEAVESWGARSKRVR